MIDALPEGKSLGAMQAPLQWITAHTIRFVGAVVITVPDGRGFILIQKGQPLVYHLQHATIALKGRAVLEYLATLPQIDFELRKYTPDELRQAVVITAGGESVPLPVQDAEPKRQELPAEQAASAEDVPLVPGTAPSYPYEEPEPAPLANPAPLEVQAAVEDMAAFEAIDPIPPEADSPLDREAMTVVREILRRPGVEGAVILRDGRDPLPMGGIDAGILAQIVGERLSWVVQSAARLNMGSLVQMTHQFDDGDVIIAPLQDACICIVTSPDAPLGHIRSQIRAIQGLS